MKFGPVSLDDAEGAIAAHAIRHAGGVVKKGTRLDAALVAALRDSGVARVVVARLDAGDVHEDVAARAVAELLAGAEVRVDEAGTGRCNLYAAHAGVFRADRATIDRLNRLDPGLTVATLPDFAAVEVGRMVATVKIIPFALPEPVLAAARDSAGGAALSVAAFRPLKVGLAATMLPGLKPSVMDKTRRILDARLARAGAAVIAERRIPHDVAALADALRALRDDGADLVVAFGASAITDDADVIPAAIRAAGGTVAHFGMPVDPGNLLLLGALDDAPVIGAPGCARSPAENGFDWVLDRLLAGLDVTPLTLTGMGVGGLLMESVSRPQPREILAQAGTGRVAALVLAAGLSSRMGGPNKLLARFDGVPLVRRVAAEALASRAGPVIVVTGHMATEIAAALAGLDVALAHNPRYAEGLSTSLVAGLAALPADVSGALVLLGDMPDIDAACIDRLVTAHAASPAAIVLPTVEGRRGNPVLWPRALFSALMEVTGDTGARHLLTRHADAVETIELGPAAARDLDTPEAVAAAGGVFGRVANSE